MTAEELLAAIDKQIADRSILTHPFYQAWQNGELTTKSLADYTCQYYNHVAAFPTYLSALHSHCADTHTRRDVLQNLVDEEAGHPNHPELWLQFANAFGVTNEQVKTTPAEPEARAMVASFDGACRKGSVAAGLAALYSYESQIPLVSSTKIEGLARHYGVTADSAIAYFRVHITADVEHARVERELLKKHLADADAGDALQASAASLDALWNLLTGVCERHGIATC